MKLKFLKTIKKFAFIFEIIIKECIFRIIKMLRLYEMS